MPTTGRGDAPAANGSTVSPDATTNERANSALDKAGAHFSVAELEQLVDVGADWVWQTNAKHEFVYFSKSVEAVTGLRPSRALGKSWFNFFATTARHNAKYAAHLADLKAFRPFREFIYEVTKPTDLCRYVSVSGFPRFDENGGFAGYCGTGRNVTTMVEALDELRETRRALSLRESRRKLVHDASAGRSHAEKLMAALNAMHDGFCYFDSDGKLALYNDAMVDMYAGLEDVIRPGMTFERLLQVGLERCILLSGDIDHMSWVDAVMAKRREEQWEQVIAFGDGRFCMHREICTEDGGRIGISTDITDLKKREEELARAKRHSEDLLSDLGRTIDSMAMGVVLVDASLQAEIINRAFYDIWKVTPRDVPVGSHFRQLMDINRHNGIYDVPDDQWEDYVQSRLAEIRAGDVAPREFRRADGCTMIYAVTALSGGKRLISYYDITELKQREAQLGAALEQAKLAEAVIDSVADPIFVKDEKLEFVLVNKAFGEVFGVHAESMIGKKAADYFTPELASSFEESEQAVLDTGEVFEVEEDFEVEGAPKSRIVRKSRVSIAGGKNYVAGTIFNVTELKRREREASDARKQLESVLNSLPAAVIVYDRDDRFVTGNKMIFDAYPALAPAMRKHGTLREALEQAHAAGYFRNSGNPEVDRLYDVDRDAWIEEYSRKYHVAHAEYERQNPDGRWFKVFDTRTPEGFFIGVRIDITDVKEREAALRESMRENEIFRNLIDNVPVAIYAKKPDLRLMYVNKGWCDLTGYTEEEAIGHTDVDVFGPEGEALMESDRRVLESGEMVEAEEIVTHPDGSTRYQIARKGVFTASDGSVYLIGSTSNITELKQREVELEEARKKAILADRAKSEFLANMSHEIRTPMNGVLGMAELLSNTDLDGKQRTFVDIIVKSGNALLTIINDILDFSKIDSGQLVLDPAPFNLAEAVEDVATLVSTRAKEKDLELIVRVQPGLNRTFVGDVGRIRQIITNLVGNAVKFTDAGHVLIDVSGEAGPESSRLKVSVTDTGIGIPADKLALVFEKFSQVDSSSTRRHEGTGLGLAITSRLVDMMGGTVGVESKEGEGSTFWFTIELPHAGPQVVERITPMDVTGARVLVVDDNEVNRAILSEQMAAWRFDACAAESGVVGIQVLKAAAARGLAVDCIVLDYQMPRMNGIEMARLVRDTPGISDVPIVMLTSVDQSLSNMHVRDLVIDAQLIKPVRSSLLLETLVATIQKHRVQKGAGAPAAKPLPAGPMPAAPAPAAAPGAAMAAVPQPAPVAQVQSASEAGLDILVAEDNEVNQLVFTQILGETPHRFHIVGNGELAVQVYKETRPRMILMDVSMPGMNGLEATGAIRELEKTSGVHVPIVGVTAHALKGDRERCLEAGMDDYLSKPISPNALLEKVATWLGEGAEAVQQAG